METLKQGKKKDFWEQYDELSVGRILEECVKGGKEVRQAILEREQKGEKRDAIILPLVNWNS